MEVGKKAGYGLFLIPSPGNQTCALLSWKGEEAPAILKVCMYVDMCMYIYIYIYIYTYTYIYIIMYIYIYIYIYMCI
jgi:hypothetical protein